MLRNIADVFRQYRDMISRSHKRHKTAEATRIMAAVLSRLGPGDIALDCGANVGVVTEQLAATGATVQAFEPDPMAFEALQARVAGMANVTIHHAAVGADAGEVHLMRNRNFHKDPLSRTVGSTVVEGARKISHDPDSYIPVQQLSLPDFIDGVVADGTQIAFLKLDIEGAEVAVLEEMERRNQFDHITLTVAETHEKKFARLRARIRGLRRRLGDRYPLSKVNLDWH